MEHIEQVQSGVKQVVIEADYHEQRLDNFLKCQLTGVPTSAIYRLIRTGQVRVNKKRAKPLHKLQAADIVRIPPVKLSPQKVVIPNSKRIKLIKEAVIYEDEALLVVNKPPGIAVHGGSGVSMGLIEIVRAFGPGYDKAELAHRIDKYTSGIVLICKRRSHVRALHAQFRANEVKKCYLALVEGELRGSREIDFPLERILRKSGERFVQVNKQYGKLAKTHVRAKANFGDRATLIEAKPISGRTHQIRVHCAYIQHPIACDDKYGGTSKLNHDGLASLALHAKYIKITHPVSQKLITFKANLPSHFQLALANLAKKYQITLSEQL